MTPTSVKRGIMIKITLYIKEYKKKMYYSIFGPWKKIIISPLSRSYANISKKKSSLSPLFSSPLLMCKWITFILRKSWNVMKMYVCAGRQLINIDSLPPTMGKFFTFFVHFLGYTNVVQPSIEWLLWLKEWCLSNSIYVLGANFEVIIMLLKQL